MDWNIPGTVLVVPRDRAEGAEEMIRSMFLAGGMVRSQVAQATGLEPYAVQNWVKRGFLSPPVNKRYTCRQFCRIILINMLKSALPMEEICGLLSYINGHLDDESDDAIDDSQLYFAFLRVAARYRGRMENDGELRSCIRESLGEYHEPFPGARERVEQVLHIMLLAWTSARLQTRAETMLAAIQEKGE